MQTPTPIPKPTVGKTFVVAISILGAIAALEILAVGWAYLAHPRRSQPPQRLAAAPENKLNLEDSFTPPAAAVPEATPAAPPAALPSPTPATFVQAAPPAPPVKSESPTDAQFAALIEQARALRERGDTSTALTRLREAMTISPNEPEVISELAITYEKMGLTDKALDQWKRIFDMGESAGIYYAAAEAKIKSSETPTPAPEATPKEDIGIQPGSVLGLLDITSTDEMDPSGTRLITLRIPVKARPNSNIEVASVIIHVFFYDIIDDQNIVQIQDNPNVTSHWGKLPADWVDSDVEILEVQYPLSIDDVKEKQAQHRKYYGYAVRIYYKDELQDVRAEPVKLLKQFPPPVTLTNGAK